jgi:putative N6-adenine-specific DNA methylase
LEPIVAGELRTFGIDAREEEGGVAFTGTLEVLARANLWLRTASRIIVRVATFHARSFAELERRARAVPWEEFLTPGMAAQFRVTSRKSRLYHTEGIAQRLAEAVERRLGAGAGRVDLASGASEHEESDEAGALDAQLFVARFVRDSCTLSIDSSGQLLHRRGYRQAVAKAPLRETLAAALLLASGWRGDTPLVDPLCGSGTIPIEGALIARRIAPGLHRDFAFERWPKSDAKLMRRLRGEAESLVLPRALVPIHGSDRDTGAIEAARSNAARARVSGDVDFSVRAISAAEAPMRGGARGGGAGLVVANPPYGVRVGESAPLRNLYAQFGKVLRARFPGWAVCLLAADDRLGAQLGLELVERLRTTNGGIPVRLLVGAVASEGETDVAHREVGDVANGDAGANPDSNPAVDGAV